MPLMDIKPSKVEIVVSHIGVGFERLSDSGERSPYHQVVVADKPYEPPASEIARRPEHIPSEAGGPLASTPPDPVTVAPQHLIGAIGTAVVRNDNLDYVPE